MNIDQQNMLPIGTILRGTYRIEKHLSSGGFGNTYVVTHTQFEETYAMKEFFMKGINQRDGQTTVSVSNAENQGQFDSQLEKFKKEALRLRRLQNENTVRVHDLFEENSTAYYVMDLIDGESLSDKMKRLGRSLTETEVMALLPQVLHALEGVHNQQIWHLDLKPGNIMTDRQGRAVLIVFGASKQMDASQGYTGTSTTMPYTPGFAPPEQIEGSLKRIGPWTDFYALGATIYNLLTRQQPPSSTDVMMEGEDAFHFPASLSSDMRQLIIWMMEARPASRPQSVEEIGQRMGQVEEVKTPEPIKITESVDTVLHDTSAETRLHESVAPLKHPIVKLTPELIEAVHKYGKIEPFCEGYAKVERNGKYGFINIDGIEVVPCQYDCAWDFSGGLAPVELNDKRGFVNTDGVEVIPCQYDDAWFFSDGMAPIELDGKWGFINTDGTEVIPHLYDYAWNFTEGMAPVLRNGKWGFINTFSAEVIPCQYDDVEKFSEGLARIKSNGNYGFINTDGVEVIPCRYSNAWGFSEGLARVWNNGKYGFINTDGVEIIPCRYDGADSFTEGLARVRCYGKSGFINTNGMQAIPCQYDSAGTFSDGLARILRNGKWGFINADGVEVIPCRYDGAEDFSEGLAVVKLGGKYGYVDKHGNDTFRR